MFGDNGIILSKKRVQKGPRKYKRRAYDRDQHSQVPKLNEFSSIFG